MERQTTLDDLLRRWEKLKEQNETATIEDLSADVKDDPAAAGCDPIGVVVTTARR